MRDSNRGDDRGNLEKLGQNAGAIAGRAMDVGMEVSGALFRSAADMLGGWWSGDEAQSAAKEWDDACEQRCRSHFDSTTASTRPDPSFKSASAAMRADSKGAQGEANVGGAKGARGVGSTGRSGFDQARPGYQFGYVARKNPDYRGRDFKDVEPELRSVWERNDDMRRAGSWPEVRGFVDFAYQQDDTRR